MVAGSRLPRVQTKKELREFLEDWITPSGRDGDGCRGRPKTLKSYVLETNGGCKREGSEGDLRWSMDDTGVEKTKILRVESSEGAHELFLDIADDRFYILHTNERSEVATRIVNMFADCWSHSFDKMWMHHGLLEAISNKAGNSLVGFGAGCSGGLGLGLAEDECGSEAGGLDLAVSGPMARTVEKTLRENDRLENAVAYNRLRILRGEAGDQYDFSCDDVTSTGYFVMKHGRSVPDHLDLVRISKDVYSGTIDGIEGCRQGTRIVDGKRIAGGSTLNFRFKTPIRDMPLFIRRTFASSKPFRLWGIESELEDGYFDVVGLDLHTGDAVNFELTRDFMRVYLSKGSCGNTVLRLLANLQVHYGRGVSCEQVDQFVR